MSVLTTHVKKEVSNSFYEYFVEVKDGWSTSDTHFLLMYVKISLHAKLKFNSVLLAFYSS